MLERKLRRRDTLMDKQQLVADKFIEALKESASVLAIAPHLIEMIACTSTNLFIAVSDLLLRLLCDYAMHSGCSSCAV